ncbi:hypothetical protein MHSWG343_04890 [Candidatus Mycoplasma haematohominis]|uniref:Uncharacterized protein n=1 Tax=Candidatus Mycoplasma haematohominis TaxID=1494318 RepID=A0A478FQA9_9MOLU|nr:hypothetical protein MHSWG343_04890 [Candidatus Mycoplasma haemohominis]
MDPIKLSAAALGALIIGGTGIGLHFFVDSMEPVWYALSYESNSSSTYDKKVGKDYGNYLVGVYGDTKDIKDRNKKWWEWSHKQFEYDLKNDRGSLSSEFFDNSQNKSKVSGAYKSSSQKTIGDSPKALNEVCDGIYKGKTKDEVEQTSTNNTNLSKNLWKYCSHLRTRPVLLNNEGYEDETIGKDATHKDEAVATKGYDSNSSNEKFWRLRNDEFFGSKGKEGTGREATEDGIFKTLYDKKNKYKTSKDTIKDVCEQVYSRKTAEKDTALKIKDEYIKKFCYLVPDSN